MLPTKTMRKEKRKGKTKECYSDAGFRFGIITKRTLPTKAMRGAKRKGKTKECDAIDSTRRNAPLTALRPLAHFFRRFLTY